MFYPVESLKRGGRFYLCWVADSWPLRFATITHKQLWSQDIRKICDDLMKVMTNESGRPTKRFSLRLSSQLMRGLVRLYQRKVTVFLGDLCMINAHVIKSTNKKWLVQDTIVVEARPGIPRIVFEEPEQEPRVEEMIQNSGNVVANVEDITLKEPTLPELAPIYDGFGELHPDQPLQMLADRTIEMMMVQDSSNVQHSGLDIPLDFSTDKSHDKSRLAPQDVQMERISEHDVSLFKKSMGADLPDLDKEIPEIPEIPPPELPVLPEKIRDAEEKEKDIEADQSPNAVVEPSRQEEIALEELEEMQPQTRKRRYRPKLIVDKKIKLSSNNVRARIDNINLELRCQDGSEDLVNIRIPPDTLHTRPAHCGAHARSNLASTLVTMFRRNLGVIYKTSTSDKELEEALAMRSRKSRVVTVLDRIDEELEPTEQQQRDKQAQQQMEAQEVDENILRDIMNVTEPRVSEDIAMLPTQVIKTVSQAKKRASEVEIPAKRQRHSGYTSFRDSQRQAIEAECVLEADKENISVSVSRHVEQPAQIEIVFEQPEVENVPAQVSTGQRDLTSMLQEVGLADIQPYKPAEIETQPVHQRARKTGSDTSETPLGSLDRTKVSLGDSDNTTDSKRFIRDQWGTEGTMLKILKNIKEGGLQSLTIWDILSRGPLISGHKRIIAARCFTSILKLKQHGFVVVDKNSSTLEIINISLGAKFDNY